MITKKMTIIMIKVKTIIIMKKIKKIVTIMNGNSNLSQHYPGLCHVDRCGEKRCYSSCVLIIIIITMLLLLLDFNFFNF